MLEKFKENIPKYSAITIFILFLLERLYNVGMSYIEALLSKAIIHLFNILSLKYIDDLHINIGKGTDQHISSSYTLLFMLFILVLIIFIAYIIISNLTHLHFIRKPKDTIKMGSMKVKVKKSSSYLVIIPIFIFIIIAGLLIVAVTYNYTKNNYNNNAVVYIERTIDILAAYSDTKEINLLKARYRAIDGACTFQTFEKHINKVKKSSQDKITQDGIKLPFFESYAGLIKNCERN
ncbi:hypothetical protein QUF74_03750 [Candidatus Halobeggiatoa sp. HSG11]|nr:hypothetical protein [Candidatus Halobeggiatoa sp. HSG11]